MLCRAGSQGGGPGLLVAGGRAQRRWARAREARRTKALKVRRPARAPGRWPAAQSDSPSGVMNAARPRALT